MQQKFALPEYNAEDPSVVSAYEQAAQYLFNQANSASHNAQRLGATAASFIPVGKGSIKNYNPKVNTGWALVNYLEHLNLRPLQFSREY